MVAGQSQTYSVLSDRELEIVELVASGMTNEKIAEQLEISKRTVDNHISNILNKTASQNRVELVRWALKWGKVCLDQVNCCTLPQFREVTAIETASPEVTPVETPETHSPEEVALLESNFPETKASEVLPNLSNASLAS